ncbi:MAG TPA: ectoine/hydroxyectoine ABC transporter permease subunit EhuD [Acetobacteraceae bacterium]|nr:ectoine/hydroxyectoine ABC transporter permease subunit EhuD [Acetobacteraceae bacterium]
MAAPGGRDPAARPGMMYGIHWDLASPLAFALSILPILGIGLEVTIEATLLGFVVALVLGLALALLRRTQTRLIVWPTALFVEFIRDTPLLVQLYFLFFVLPDYGIVLPAFLTGALALGLQYAAYTSEVYRAGLDAIGRGQWEAATALNLSRARIYRDVVIPQAIPRIVPALGTYLVSMLKDTPILSTVTVVEMLDLATTIGDRTFRYLVPLSLVGLIFLLLTMVCSAGIRRLEAALPKTGIPMQ